MKTQLSETPISKRRSCRLASLALFSAVAFTGSQAYALPPVVSKSFNPSTLSVGGASTLLITLSNANAVPAFVTVPFVDTLPSGLSVSGAVITNTCGGTVSTTLSSVTLAGGTIPAGGSCFYSVPVTASVSGNLQNSLTIGSLQTSAGPNVAAAVATLSVTALVPAPSVVKSFSAPSFINTGGASVLTIRLNNTSSTVANITAPLLDTLPVGLTATGPATTTCVGSIASFTATTLTLTGGAIAANSFCEVSVPVTAAVAGNYSNILATGALQTSNGSSAALAAATLSVATAGSTLPVISKFFTPSSVATSTDSLLTIQLNNPSVVSATVTSLSDTLPPGLIAVAGTAATTCVGSIASNTASSLSLTGGVIPAGSFCTLTLPVQASLGGNYNNTVLAGDLITSNGNNAAAATATLNVTSSLIAPSVGKSFGPATVGVGSSSVATIRLNNPNATAAVITVPFVDVFPAGTILGTPTSNSCGGTASVAGSTFTLIGASIPADIPAGSGFCLVTIPVSSFIAGNYANTVLTGALITRNGVSANAAVATLSVVPLSVPGPSITKTFSPREISTCQVSVLTITLVNPSASVATLTSPLFDRLPHHLDICEDILNTCGGHARVEGSTLILSGASIPANGSCSVSVEVSSDRPGRYNNSLPIGALQTNQGGNALPAFATLRVVREDDNRSNTIE